MGPGEGHGGKPINLEFDEAQERDNEKRELQWSQWSQWSFRDSE